MNGKKRENRYFSAGEKWLWGCSVFLVFLSHRLFQNGTILSPIASAIGVTSLILNAKGNPLGQVFMVLFSCFYGVISYSFSYYGEMLTYFGMTAPMSLFALISWIKNPCKMNGKRSGTKIHRLNRNEVIVMILLSIVVTWLFYYVLAAFQTANLGFSTLSVTTSFVAVYLTFKRSPYFAMAYGVNDIVLIILWVLAALQDASYWSVAICFLIFLVNDWYGFIRWKKREVEQCICS